MTPDQAKNQTVRVRRKGGDQLGLFVCSSIQVGAGMAGEFLDNGEGNVIPLENMIEIVDPEEAILEARRWKAERDKARIREVVMGVEDAQEEFSGTIILHVGFKGSLAKTKALTKTESGILTSTPGSELIKGGLDPTKLKGAKTLFESEEYDAVEAFKQKRRTEFANLGIPFPLGDSMYLIKIVNIPKAEELAGKTDRELQALVARLQAVYPSQITPEATGLGSLYNAGDYRVPEALESLFRFTSKWMHFGVPSVLKEIDAALWEKERERTAEVWREAKEQGLILLRKTTAEMVARLVEAVTPAADGTKKRFYATAVTNLTDFFEAFEDRNLAGDKELEEQVVKLKGIVAGKEVADFKTDDKLRDFVKTEGSKIQSTLESMLVSSEARVITFED